MDEQKLDTNVAKGVVVRVPKSAKLREKSYTTEEARRVLKAALAPPPARTSSRSALARRWVPWLCAYTGARVNEITQLRKEDVQQQEGVWLIRITPEAGRVKTNEARLVPVHAHLVDQGFIKVVQEAGEGPLFFDADRRRGGAGESRQHKKIGERLAGWVRNEVGINDPGIAPNHAWRQTFKTLALEAGIQERVADALQGHAPSSVGQTYGHASVKTLSAAMERFPRFEVEGA
ncbi:site-specific integrase [Sphingomonas sp. IC4-52]|uniref:site-specific integrase n=1 Tax=Sphingomonas sp. IC4-52 TaxID=2887202 RepID=UPI001D0FE9D2|nr:site-specific integrase [Sphingomonas sp. IC4-52]MCC2979044.1 site-specific integrase [Sphingomonas sp. IC4-52]